MELERKGSAWFGEQGRGPEAREEKTEASFFFF
jgi:hypothetical protein